MWPRRRRHGTVRITDAVFGLNHGSVRRGSENLRVNFGVFLATRSHIDFNSAPSSQFRVGKLVSSLLEGCQERFEPLLLTSSSNWFRVKHQWRLVHDTVEWISCSVASLPKLQKRRWSSWFTFRLAICRTLSARLFFRKGHAHSTMSTSRGKAITRVTIP